MPIVLFCCKIFNHDRHQPVLPSPLAKPDLYNSFLHVYSLGFFRFYNNLFCGSGFQPKSIMSGFDKLEGSELKMSLNGKIFRLGEVIGKMKVS